MTTLAATGGPVIPRTPAEWERVREAKLDALARGPLAVDPADYPGVRPEVVASWRRSMLAGVDPAATHYVVDKDFQPNSRLAVVAEPIMNRLKDEISDLNAWAFLADRACRLLTLVVGDFPHAEHVHRQNVRPGTFFTEDIMGTNGIGCAHETKNAFIISGTEHFRTDTEVLTTTGVIIRDPFTKRYAGTLGAHCRREYTSAAVVPLVMEIGRSIEAQLLASRSDSDREFFDAFSAAERRYRSPVVAVSRRLCVVSTQARALVHEADEELLRRLAQQSGSRNRSVRRRLSSGTTVTIQVLPVDQPKGEFAAILVLQPLGNAAQESGPGYGPGPLHDNPMNEFRDRLSRAIRDGRPILLTGERGCGKRYQAQAALRSLGRPGRIAEFDGALAHLEPREWLRGLVAVLRRGTDSVLIARVTDVPADVMRTVADLVTGARTPVIGTSTDDTVEHSAAVLVRESFPVTLAVPPLRERRSEFKALCTSLLADLAEGGGKPVALAPKAVVALMASDWPGNVRQLFQVLASARIRATGPVIDLDDLPARHHRNQAGRPLDEVQAAERRVLMAALRDAGGDRNVVAERLGISRATVYRKLKRYELR
ncbi:sigma-54-dependent Fis family transcriptional regulator [Amycolatopsis pigmentata]|uniref:Sigma-54-dependent Fis family transcriptional regulator n=1 Tax=Amycolatopsis pigmentata TaxID=450801 RepID=A0ABW5FUH9_9PSEU